MNEPTHVLHWIPPELERTRKWFGRQASEWGHWELQPLEAYEAGRHESDSDFTDVPDPDSCSGKAAELRDLTASVSAILGYPVALLENVYPNPKLTLPKDLAHLEFLLAHPS